MGFEKITYILGYACTNLKDEYIMTTPAKKKPAGPAKYVCSKCGRSIRWQTRPLLQTTGKCPKVANGNHSWHKESN